MGGYGYMAAGIVEGVDEEEEEEEDGGYLESGRISVWMDR